MNKITCKNGFHGSLAEALSPVRKGKAKWVCPVCGRNYENEKWHVTVDEIIEYLQQAINRSER